MELNQQTKQENRERSGPVAWMRIWIKEVLVGIIVVNTLTKNPKLQNWKGFVTLQKLKIKK